MTPTTIIPPGKMENPSPAKASAPGKVILFGEHAVVYGRPAIAVPVIQVQAAVEVRRDERSVPGGLIFSPQAGLDDRIEDLGPEFWGAVVLRYVCQAAGLEHAPPFTMHIRSTIPVAAGLGSGAAVAVAAIRALAEFLNLDLPLEQVNTIAFEVEKIHHGNPSGIDNSVVSFEKPVYFERSKSLEILEVGRAFTIVIADTGKPSRTSLAVGDVRAGWMRNPEKYERLFDEAGAIAAQARAAIERGRTERLGALMNANHAILQAMEVSSPELDRLVQAAWESGASGAKLSGGGRGGNLIALPGPRAAEKVAMALEKAGAARTIVTEIARSKS